MVANELNGISIEKDLTLQELNKNIEEDLQTIKIVSEVVERGCLLCILFFFLLGLSPCVLTVILFFVKKDIAPP